MAALAAAKAPAEAKKLDALMSDAERRLRAIRDRAESGKEAYDQMIAQGNEEGNKLVQSGIDGLVAQAHGVEALVAALNLKITVEGSDSLDNPSAVQ
jgi:putative iron-regulated protein